MALTRPNTRSAYSSITKVFFDREAVQKRVDRALIKALKQHGQDTKSIAKRSLKSGRGKGKKTPSAPGTPPRSRTGKLKRGIVYWYDRRQQNVTTGPVLFPRMRRRDNLVMLEYGGIRPMTLPSGARVIGKYPPRPFMRPAQIKVTPKTLRKLKDAV